MTGLATVGRLALPDRYDLAGTLRGLAMSRWDPTARVSATEAWWATRTPDGPGTLHLVRDGAALAATGYGPGAGWLVERAGRIAGLHDDVTGFADLARRHPLVDRLARGRPGWRFVHTGRVFQRLLPAILEQKVTGQEAHRAYHKVLRHFGEPAPGPRPDLLLPPDTAAEVVRTAFGDADAVSVGDYHIPHTIAWALAGEPRGTDARMLDLLAPFGGHRGRVCALIESAGIGAPRFGPRMPIRSFARF